MKKSLKNWKFLPLYALAASMPFKLIFAPILLSAQFLMIFFFKDKKIEFKKELLIPIILFASYIISVLYSFDIDEGLVSLFLKSPLFLVPMFFMFDLTKKINKKDIFEVYLLSCFIFCIIAFIKLIYFTTTSGASIYDYDFVQRSIKYFHFPTEVFMLNIALVLNIKSRMWNRLKLILSSSFFLFILLSGTRLGLLLSVPLFFLNLYYVTKRVGILRKVFLFIALPLVLVFTASQSRYTKNKILDSFHYIGLFTEVETEYFSKQYHNIGFRTKLWGASINKIKQAPVFGYGLGTERQVITEEITKNQKENMGSFNAHNQYLSTYLSSGILGFLSLIAWMFYSLFIGLNKKSFEQIAVTVVVILSMFVESYFERQKGVFLIVFFLSMLNLDATRKRPN